MYCFTQCLGRRKRNKYYKLIDKIDYEKKNPGFPHEGEKGEEENTKQLASDIVQILYTTNKSGPELDRELNQIVTASGWTENLARYILQGVEAVLSKAQDMGSAMQEACIKAKDANNAIFGFAREHPIYTTLIALGVLVILSPWVLEALGFGELGSIEGTFASWWQSTYRGYVPKNSLFSYFQKLSVNWRRKAGY